MTFELGANSAIDGVPTAASQIEVSRNDARVFITRTNASTPLTEGFGVRGPSGAYDVVFSRPKRTDVELLIVHPDGSGIRMFGNKRDTVAIRGAVRGDDVMLEGPGFEHAALHLPAAGAPATLFDGTRTLPIVVARFGGDIVVGIGWSGGEIAIGRYDFERGIATTVGPHGEGTETFH